MLDQSKRADEIDRKFDDGENISEYLDMKSMKRASQKKHYTTATPEKSEEEKGD